MFNFISKKLYFLLLILIGTIFFIDSSNVYAGTLSCSLTTAANCTGTIAYRMSATKDAHAALYNQTGTPYDSNVICCTGVNNLGNSCSGTYTTVLKLSGTKNAHVQQSGSYTNNACLSVSSGTISVGYQSSNCRGYDTILGSMSGTTNAQVGNNYAYTTKICGTAAITPVISISVSDGIISYGTLPANSSKSTIDITDTQTLTNNSNVAADINIKGLNTACPWTLASSTGINQYVHQFCKTTDVSCTNPPTNYTTLSTSYKTLYQNVPVGGTRNLDLQITTPTETSCYNSQSASITIQAVEHDWVCGETVTFPYNGSNVTYGTVTSQAGECWLDRNLGASEVATSVTDTNAYGDLFQWGRLDDGHQTRTSTTTTTLSTTDNPNHNNFIINLNGDWRSSKNDNLWQGETGINNPCPTGWRLPTITEWQNEVTSGGWINYNTAYASLLKLTASGLRNSGDATIETGVGMYWSSTIMSNNARYLSTNSGSVTTSNSYSRATGGSVRCIKD